MSTKRIWKVARIDALFQPTVKMLVGLSYLIGLVYGAYLVPIKGDTW